MLSVVGLIAAASSSAPTYLPLELLRPPGDIWNRRARQTAQIMRRVVQPRTTAVPRSFDELGTPADRVALCRSQAQLACWAAAAASVVQATRNAQIASHFVLVRLVPGGGPTQVRVLVWLVDRIAAARSRTIDSEQREAWLLSRATVRRRIDVSDWDDGGLERALQRLWDERKPVLQQRGEWRPNGKVHLKSTWVPPFRVRTDEGLAITATASQVLLHDVGVGDRRVELDAVDRRVARTVTVDMGRTTVLHLNESHTSSARDGGERRSLLWTGIGVAAVGASVAIGGLAIPVDAQVIRLCGGDDCASPSRFARSSDYFSAREENDGGRGPLVVPLGYSLLITGTAWALTAALTDEGEDVPWWAVVIGGVLGGAAYGISEVANGSSR
ncbi:MAG: hypothetical protein AAF449_21740 [Myxococcota bacterium]